MKKSKKNKLLDFVTVVTLSFIVLFSIRANALPISEIFNSEFDTQVAAKMELGQIPTSTICMINRTEVVFTKTYGEQSSLDLVYRLNSINKVVIGVATLQLVEEGLIDINADINNYLPYIIENPNFPETAITCKHLLAHRAGINDRANNNTVYKLIFNSTIVFPDYIYEFLNVNGSFYNQSYWEYQPGEDYTYATLDFEILSYIIELVTGETILDYIQTNILDPLMMIDTKNSFSDYNPNEIATPYIWDSFLGIKKQITSYDINTSLDYKTTAADLSKFTIDLMNGLYYGNSSLLNSTTITEYMFKHQGSGHGLGIFVDWDDRDWNYKGYFGNGLGYSSLMIFKEHIGVVCFVNQCGSDEDLVMEPSVFQNIMQYLIYLMEQSQRMDDPPIEPPCSTCTTITTILTTTEGNYYLSLLPIALFLTISFILIRKRRK